MGYKAITSRRKEKVKAPGQRGEKAKAERKRK
jgi:hypothetical protein